MIETQSEQIAVALIRVQDIILESFETLGKAHRLINTSEVENGAGDCILKAIEGMRDIRERLGNVLRTVNPEPKVETREPMSPGQTRMYNFLVQFINENKCPPTMREIAKGLGYNSFTGACHHIKRLKDKGYVEKDPMKARGIRIIP